MSEKVRRIILIFIFFYMIDLIIALLSYDVAGIGPASTTIGLAGVNGWFRRISGFGDSEAYSVPLYGAVCVLGGLSGIVCLFWSGLFIRDMVCSGRADGVGTDKNLAASFFLYILTALNCGLFRLIHINYGPVLTSELKPAVSFPSAAVLWIIIAMGSTVFHIWDLLGEKKRPACILSIVCTAVMILGIIFGLVCGRYWFTDIIGAVLLGAMLILLYSFFFYI